MSKNLVLGVLGRGDARVVVVAGWSAGDAVAAWWIAPIVADCSSWCRHRRALFSSLWDRPTVAATTPQRAPVPGLCGPLQVSCRAYAL